MKTTERFLCSPWTRFRSSRMTCTTVFRSWGRRSTTLRWWSATLGWWWRWASTFRCRGWRTPTFWWRRWRPAALREWRWGSTAFRWRWRWWTSALRWWRRWPATFRWWRCHSTTFCRWRRWTTSLGRRDWRSTPLRRRWGCAAPIGSTVRPSSIIVVVGSRLVTIIIIIVISILVAWSTIGWASLVASIDFAIGFLRITLDQISIGFFFAFLYHTQAIFRFLEKTAQLGQSVTTRRSSCFTWAYFALF